ncbi:hypothetical protein BC827DRAFT_1387502 [Russula dissimulans]|nr:hypothetical protein BC827DRAFT_1387502 [Russula dissimulans]
MYPCLTAAQATCGRQLQNRCPPNVVRNQMYNAFTFLPIMFYEQFKFFSTSIFFSSRYLNSSLHSEQIKHLTTITSPILTAKPTLRATLTDDDDLSHGLPEGNLPPTGDSVLFDARGDLVLLEKNQRVPADMMHLRADQLNGETDWNCASRSRQRRGFL